MWRDAGEQEETVLMWDECIVFIVIFQSIQGHLTKQIQNTNEQYVKIASNQTRM